MIFPYQTFALQRGLIPCFTVNSLTDGDFVVVVILEFGCDDGSVVTVAATVTVIVFSNVSTSVPDAFSQPKPG